MTDLRLGRWQDVLADVMVDSIITDPPYSARTHASETGRADGVDAAGLAPTYDAWTVGDVVEFVSSWSPRCRGWMAALTDSELIPTWRDAYRSAGRYAFSPVPAVISGMSVRITGDGPSSEAVYLMVARPSTREFATWGTLPGKYIVPRSAGSGGGRGKPQWLMNALVRDYTRRGALVCDPMAGWGSTLAAAIANGRLAVGAEMDAVAHAEAMRRLARPQQIDLLETGVTS